MSNPYQKLDKEVAGLRGESKPYSTDLNAAFELVAEMGNNNGCVITCYHSTVEIFLGDEDTPCTVLYHVGEEMREQDALEPAAAICLAYVDFKKAVLRGEAVVKERVVDSNDSFSEPPF